MYQIWVGPKPGINEVIIQKPTLAEAEDAAQDSVKVAKSRGESRIAHIYAGGPGKVISGFMTPNLVDVIKNPCYKVVE